MYTDIDSREMASAIYDTNQLNCVVVLIQLNCVVFLDTKVIWHWENWAEARVWVILLESHITITNYPTTYLILLIYLCSCCEDVVPPPVDDVIEEQPEPQNDLKRMMVNVLESMTSL